MPLLTVAVLTPWRLRWYPRLLLSAAAAAFLLTLFTGEGAKIPTGRLGGDFPEFYGAGRIVAEGNLAGLYDREVQSTAQRGLVPDDKEGKGGGFIPFAYPPHLALFYSLLSRFPYRAAFALQTALSTAALFLAAWLMRDAYPPASRHVLAVFAAMVFFYPTFRALLGGQNTPLSLLFIVAAHACCLRGRDFTAGVLLGLLLYKPQFGLIFLCAHALAGRWRVVWGGAATGLAVSLLNTVAFGPEWVWKWLTYAGWVIDTSMAMESEKAVSLMGVFKSLASRTNFDVAWIGRVLAVAVGILLSLAWLRAGRAGWGEAPPKAAPDRRGDVPGWTAGDRVANAPGGMFGIRQGGQAALVGLASAGAVLIAPHAYYYDTGLLLPAFMAFAQSDAPGRSAILLAAWAFGFAQLLAETVGMSPLVFLALATFLAMLAMVRPKTASRID